jgi:hypothetical protein
LQHNNSVYQAISQEWIAVTDGRWCDQDIVEVTTTTNGQEFQAPMFLKKQLKEIAIFVEIITLTGLIN